MDSPPTEEKLGRQFRKIQPKLRMIAKAHDSVNAARCDFASAVRISADAADGLVSQSTPRVCGDVAQAELATPELTRTSNAIEASVFVSRFAGASTDSEGLVVDCETADGSLATATLKLNRLGKVAENDDIAQIELGEPLRPPEVTVTSQNPTPLLATPLSRDAAQPVLVGIIDVGGFDFSHADFLDTAGATRWLSIWDQGGGARPEPEGFQYGSEITKAHMDAALVAQADPEIALPAWSLEPQSQMAVGSHGTHVASIAAGNSGVCPNALLAGVIVSLPDEVALDRRKSFYDSTRVAHAVDYLLAVAEQTRKARGLDELPVSINVSLGTNGGAHDASNAVSRWIDSRLLLPGRSVCVAAGNAGQEKSTGPGDVGFISGRIHTSGRIEARGLTSDIEWVVVGNGIADVSENEFELWYSGSDRFAVSITPPGMPTIGPVEPRQFVQNHKLLDDTFVSVYNELYHPANGENYIAIYLSPFLKENPVVGVKPGLWKIRIHGREVRDGRYHAWIERDDPRRRGVIDEQEYWNFPSFFTARSNVDNSSVSSLACGERIVSVANLDQERERINISSSQGPTRDGRFKPDVAAAGTKIVAAKGFAAEDEGAWVAMTGTSMASPRVAGVIAQMLRADPKLTAAQIRGIIQRTSQPLPGRNFAWADDSGYGTLDPEQCVAEARNQSQREKLKP